MSDYAISMSNAIVKWLCSAMENVPFYWVLDFKGSINECRILVINVPVSEGDEALKICSKHNWTLSGATALHALFKQMPFWMTNSYIFNRRQGYFEYLCLGS